MFTDRHVVTNTSMLSNRSVTLYPLTQFFQNAGTPLCSSGACGCSQVPGVSNAPVPLLAPEREARLVPLGFA